MRFPSALGPSGTRLWENESTLNADLRAALRPKAIYILHLTHNAMRRHFLLNRYRVNVRCITDEICVVFCFFFVKYFHPELGWSRHCGEEYWLKLTDKQTLPFICIWDQLNVVGLMKNTVIDLTKPSFIVYSMCWNTLKYCSSTTINNKRDNSSHFFLNSHLLYC